MAPPDFGLLPRRSFRGVPPEMSGHRSIPYPGPAFAENLFMLRNLQRYLKSHFLVWGVIVYFFDCNFEDEISKNKSQGSNKSP